MSWLLPSRIEAKQARLEAVLAESERAREQAEKAAREVAASAAADQRKIEATRREIRCRTDQRQERARKRPAQDPTLTAAVDALKLLERRQ